MNLSTNATTCCVVKRRLERRNVAVIASTITTYLSVLLLLLLATAAILQEVSSFGIGNRMLRSGSSLSKKILLSGHACSRVTKRNSIIHNHRGRFLSGIQRNDVTTTSSSYSSTNLHQHYSRMRLFSTNTDSISNVEIESNTKSVHNYSNHDEKVNGIDDDDELIVSFDSDDDEESDSNSRIRNFNHENYQDLPKGTNEGFYVVRVMKTPDEGFAMETIRSVIGEDQVERLYVSSTNLTIAAALMILDPAEYPALSRARRAIRRANIMIHRGPILDNERINDNGTNKTTPILEFDQAKCITAKVGDRIYPGDVIAEQTRMGEGYFPREVYDKPPFDLPVVYEDDHFAIVNKPAGVVVYSHKNGGHGTMTVRAALPFAVTPPKKGTYSTMRRPQPVHRLDKPTSGLLIVAKTKPAMVHLSLQFRDRKIKKTYVAICSGVLPELSERLISAEEAFELGVDVNTTLTCAEDSSNWQLIDHALEGKSAVTIWRALKYAKSLKANDNYLTLVELKPKTGRFHQLRRHMAWVCESPIIGDREYDGGRPDALSLRERGLFLCSNRVTLEHPYYNTADGRQVYDQLSEADKEELKEKGISVHDDNRVMITVEMDIPDKFENFMERENDRYERLSSKQEEEDNTPTEA